jgi:sugar lactone lactonase YvrE
MAPTFRVLDVPPSTLGECPVWDADAAALYWLDCVAPALYRRDDGTGAVRRWALPLRTGSFALTTDGGAILADSGGFAALDLATGAVRRLAAPEAGKPELAFNDGAIDPLGRFWAGSMHRSLRGAVGALWCWDGKRAAAFASGYTVPNGIAWSPDGRTLYINDSPRGMAAHDFDAAGPTLGPARPFGAPAPGYADGSAVDEDGFLWNARWDGGGVARFAPDGSLNLFVRLPVTRPTSCAFGGPERRTLFVTSARVGLSAETLAREPAAGRIFAVDVGHRGLPQRRFTPCD